jgi:ABC-type transport system involved in multi-copper enzyme maturation permease subunit
MIRQTAAIFLDAYRELNSKRLFWVVLLISGLVVAAFAAVGIDEKGLTLLSWHFPSVFNTSLVPADLFYKWVFFGLGIKIWLTWAATILALVSTAGIIPEFLASGAIELALSKPIGRLRLFLTKYAAGLLFVTLQVAVFTAASFLVIGLRGGTWEGRLFWAVPITVCMFSYVYCVCALLGVLTRSTIASLLLALLLWFGFFGVHTTETMLLVLRERSALRVEALEKRVAEREALSPAAAPARAALPASTNEATEEAGADGNGSFVAAAAAPPENRALTTDRALLAEERQSSASLRRWHGLFFALKTVLPKTAETTDLLQRTLMSREELDRLGAARRNDSIDPMPDRRVRISGRELARRVEAIHLGRPTSWVLGTSLAFEAAVLGLAAWRFCRRDF